MRIATFIGILLIGGGAALGAPPEELGDITSFETELREALVAAEAAAVEAARDPDREYVRDYLAEKEHGHDKVVSMIANSANDRRNRGLREVAAKAIADRFSASRRRDDSDAKRHASHKKQVSEELVELLHTRYEKRTNQLAITVLEELWKPIAPKYNVNGSKREKGKSIDNWKRFLKRK